MQREPPPEWTNLSDIADAELVVLCGVLERLSSAPERHPTHQLAYAKTATRFRHRMRLEQSAEAAVQTARTSRTRQGEHSKQGDESRTIMRNKIPGTIPIEKFTRHSFRKSAMHIVVALQSLKHTHTHTHTQRH